MLDHQKVTSSHTRRYSLTLVVFVISSLLLVTSGSIKVHVVQAGASQLVMLPGSVPQQIAHAKLIGHHSSRAPITIGILMQTNNVAEMNTLLKALYNRYSPLYHHWLEKGEFDQRFGPTNNQLTKITNFLRQTGLRIVPSHVGTKVVLASGLPSQVEATFHTTINDYRLSNGEMFFANSTGVQIPGTLQGVIKGVFGLCNAPAVSPINLHIPRAHPRYGGGTNGSGLIPSQVESIYDATPLYKGGNTGQGVTLAVFELSGYTASDIQAYEQQFSLPNVPLTNISVSGGPSDSSGAAEVELDIELQIALAPGAKAIEVYNASNSDQGLILEYQQIANDDTADAISTSWGQCELAASQTSLSAENTAATQMAMQGQSIFAASGDSGAYSCDTSIYPEVLDPASQPLFTAVGGTSFGSFDPGSDANPNYPNGDEVIWNNGCEGSGLCKGGGGGVSRLWADPGFQDGAPGVKESSFSQSGSYCGQSNGTPCREVPDVSLNADPNTGYSIFCTDSGSMACSGWVQIGGTSAAAPLWASIAALLDVQQGKRVGQFTKFIYQLDSSGYGSQLHDITNGNNGYYPAGADYDMASGLGTPNIALFVRNP
jgi:subtilase family serine protease